MCVAVPAVCVWQYQGTHTGSGKRRLYECGSTGVHIQGVAKGGCMCVAVPGFTYREWEREAVCVWQYRGSHTGSGKGRLYECSSAGVSKKPTTIIYRIVGDVNEILCRHTRDDPTVLYETYATMPYTRAHTHVLSFLFVHIMHCEERIGRRML
jgi:hypothetical protein